MRRIMTVVVLITTTIGCDETNDNGYEPGEAPTTVEADLGQADDEPGYDPEAHESDGGPPVHTDASAENEAGDTGSEATAEPGADHAGDGGSNGTDTGPSDHTDRYEQADVADGSEPSVIDGLQGCPDSLDGQTPLSEFTVHSAASIDEGETIVTTGTVVEASSVPDGLLWDDGTHWVYHINGTPGQHGIWISREIDSGWERFACVKLDGLFDEHAVDPDVMFLPDGRIRLFYYANFNNIGSDGLQYIRFADSTDGVNFMVSGEVGAWTSTTDPTVIRLSDGTYIGTAMQRRSQVFFRSDDGETFEEFFPSLPEATPEGTAEIVETEDGTLKLMMPDSVYASPDYGETWEQSPTFLLDDHQGQMGSPSITVQDDGSWIMFYKSWNPS